MINGFTVPKVIISCFVSFESFKTSKSQFYFYLEILNIQVGRVYKPRKKKNVAFQGMIFPGLDISQGTEANGRGALTDWPCALKNSHFPFARAMPS
jgi:hypothetical protein